MASCTVMNGSSAAGLMVRTAAAACPAASASSDDPGRRPPELPSCSVLKTAAAAGPAPSGDGVRTSHHGMASSPSLGIKLGSEEATSSRLGLRACRQHSTAQRRTAQHSTAAIPRTELQAAVEAAMCSTPAWKASSPISLMGLMVRLWSGLAVVRSGCGQLKLLLTL